MSRRLGALAAGLLVALVTPLAVPAGHAQAQGPAVGPNGRATSLGWVDMPDHPFTRTGSVEVNATLVFSPDGALDRAHRVLLSFNVHDPEMVKVDFHTLETADGTPLNVTTDERDPANPQTRVFVTPEQLPPPGEPVHVGATVYVTASGRFHVGFMAIAFDENWTVLPPAEGEDPVLYAFSTVGADGPSPGPAAAPLRGSGNVVPAPGALVGLAVVSLAAWGLRRR